MRTIIRAEAAPLSMGFLDELFLEGDETLYPKSDATFSTADHSTDGPSIWSLSARSSSVCSSTIGSLEPSVLFRDNHSTRTTSNVACHKLLYSQHPEMIKTEEDLLNMAICLNTGLVEIRDDDNDEGSSSVVDGRDNVALEPHHEHKQLKADARVIQETIYLRHRIATREDSVVESTFLPVNDCENVPLIQQRGLTSNRSLGGHSGKETMSSSAGDESRILVKEPDFDKKMHTVFIINDLKVEKRDTKNSSSSPPPPQGLMAHVASDTSSAVQDLLVLESSDDQESSLYQSRDGSSSVSASTSERTDTYDATANDDSEDQEGHSPQTQQKKEGQCFSFKHSMKKSLENIFSKQNLRQTSMAYVESFAPPVPMPVTGTGNVGNSLVLDDYCVCDDESIEVWTADAKRVAPPNGKRLRSRSIKAVKKLFKRESLRKAAVGYAQMFAPV